MLADLDFAHAVPHYRAPRWVADSGLAADASPGLVDIDPGTLRHRRHDAIWALGDAAALQTRSSGGGLREQVKVLSANLAAARDGGRLQEYDGYTVMPVTVSRRQLMLAEVDRDGRPTRRRAGSTWRSRAGRCGCSTATSCPRSTGAGSCAGRSEQPARLETTHRPGP